MDVVVIKDVAISIGVLVATGTLLFHIRTARAVARQNVWNSFFSDFENINNYIVANNGAPGGGGNIIKMPYPEMKSGAENVSLIFHHMNLIFRFWINIKLLKKHERIGFQRWTKMVFFNWISSNANLSRDLETIVKFKDLYPDPFLDWFSGHEDYQLITRKNAGNNA